MNTALRRGTRVDIYRNLHSGTWSVRDCKSGRVTDHVDMCSVYDAKLVVQPAGRRRVLREGRKNVHAFVRGYIYHPTPSWTLLRRYMKPITYNPYTAKTFTFKDSGEAIHAATVVVLDTDGVLAYQGKNLPSYAWDSLHGDGMGE